MAPVQLPPPISERYLIGGTGAITLTEAQRGARSLSMVIEKVRPVNPNGEGQVTHAYFNQKWPEPQSHWGYFQMMRRDFVAAGGPLTYRREVIFERDNWTAEILARLRCYLEKDHDYSTFAFESILGALGEDVLGGGTPNIDGAKAAWEASLEFQLFPTHPETALWYELADGWRAQITITHQPYAVMNCGIEAQPLPPAKVPGSGESGDPGVRQDRPIPPGRRTDPLSDNISPPSNSVTGPPVPEATPPLPREGRVRVTVGVFSRTTVINGSVTTCLNDEALNFNIIFDTNDGPVTMRTTLNAQGGRRIEAIGLSGAVVRQITNEPTALPCPPRYPMSQVAI